MRIKRVISIIILAMLVLLSFSNNKVSYGESGCCAKAMIVLDTNSGRVLAGKNYDERLPIASTTKIVTALTVLYNCKNLDKEIEIDKRAVGVPGTSIYLKEGEKLTIKELLYGMMLPSGNDSATALAYYIGGSIEKFCNLMNKTAILCGANNSSFENPHGLDSDNHYTTAYDLAKITAKALENDIFKEIVTTKSTRIKGSSVGAYRYLKNKNKLLNTLDGCLGVKTGFTNKAGRCLVSACERAGFRTVCVVLNCGPMFEESEKLFNYVYGNYSYTELLGEYKIIRNVDVNDGKSESVKVFTKRGFSYPLLPDEEKMLEYRYLLPNSIDAPVKKDEIVGDLEIYLNNHLLFSEKIYTMDSVKKIGVWSNIKDIASKW